MTSEPVATSRDSLNRIADALEMIALFLQVLAEGQASDPAESVVVETQSGPVKLG